MRARRARRWCAAVRCSAPASACSTWARPARASASASSPSWWRRSTRNLGTPSKGECPALRRAFCFWKRPDRLFGGRQMMRLGLLLRGGRGLLGRLLRLLGLELGQRLLDLLGEIVFCRALVRERDLRRHLAF